MKIEKAASNNNKAVGFFLLGIKARTANITKANRPIILVSTKLSEKGYFQEVDDMR